jgi:hypothetical protein
LLRIALADGSSGFSKAWIHWNGRLVEAQIGDTPWLTELKSTGEPLNTELTSDLGVTRICGRPSAR